MEIGDFYRENENRMLASILFMQILRGYTLNFEQTKVTKKI